MAVSLKRNKPDTVVNELREEIPLGYEDKKKKPRRKRGRLVFVLILILLLAGVVTAGYFVVRDDLFGVRTRIIETVLLLDPSFVSYKRELENIRARELELSDRQNQLDDELARIAARETRLDNYEQELSVREASLIPIYRQPMTEDILADMESISRTYANMDPADAARILASIGDLEDMTAIIYYMPERSRAAILAQMDVRLAAQITDMLLTQ